MRPDENGMKTKSKWLILAGLIAVIGLVAAFGLNRGSQVQHFTAKVERGEIDDVVEAAGTINAVITVQVGSQVSGTIANVTQAEAQVTQKAAAVTVAQTNLNYTVIRSPIDGTVVARNVDVGQTVAASLQAPTIFTIAQDLTKMWVYAKTDESDVGNIKVGKPVTFKVDAFPKDTFRGVVNQVRMNATMVQSVVTYDTIIEFANPDLKLFPGMTEIGRAHV